MLHTKTLKQICEWRVFFFSFRKPEQIILRLCIKDESLVLAAPVFELSNCVCVCVSRMWECILIHSSCPSSTITKRVFVKIGTEK